MNKIEVVDSNNNNNNNFLPNVGNSLQKHTKEELLEIANKLLVENEQLHVQYALIEKRKNDDTEIYEPNKKQKVEDRTKDSQYISKPLSKLFLYFEDKPHFSETCTFLFYKKGDLTPLKFIIPCEALLASSKKYQDLFKSKGNCFQHPIPFNDPIQGPFYSHEAVGQLFSFIFSLSRNFKEDLRYRPITSYPFPEDALEDLLQLISIYQVDDRLLTECANFIYNKIIANRQLIAKYFNLAFSFPFLQLQDKWCKAVLARNIVLEDCEIFNELFDSLEKGFMKNKNLQNTLPLIKVLFYFSGNISNHPQVKDDFLERLYKNILHIIVQVPDLFLKGIKIDDPKPKDLTSPFALMFSCFYYCIKEENEKATEKLNQLLLSKEFQHPFVFLLRALLSTDADESLKELDYALESNSEFCLPLVKRSLIHKEKGNRLESLNDIEVALKICPDHFYLYAIKGDILLHFHDHQGAIDSYQLSIQRLEKMKGFHYQKALIYYKLERHWDALRSMEKLLKKEKGEADLFLFMGKIKLALDSKECLAEFQKAIDEDSKNPDTYYKIAELLCDAQLFLEEAEEYIDQTKTLTEPTANILSVKGEIKYRLGDLNEAWQLLEASYHLDSKNSYHLALMAEFQMHLNKLGYALKLIEESLMLESDQVYALRIKGAILFRKGRMTEALSYANQALALNPKNAETYILLAEIHLHLKENEKALEALYSFKIKNKPKAYFLIAKVLFFKNDLTGALHEIENAEFVMAKMNKNSHFNSLLKELYQLKGEILSKMEDKEGAKLSFNVAIRFDRDDGHLFFLRGKVQKELGKIGEAIEDFSTAILYQDHQEALVQRAILYWKRGDKQLALEDAKRILEKDPGSHIQQEFEN